MCYGCYKEYGKPEIINDKTIEAADLTNEVYKISPDGGHCHVVVDDFNIDDNHIEFCLKNIAKDDRSFTTEDNLIQRKCMEVYLSLTIKERASALAIFEGWLDVKNYKMEKEYTQSQAMVMNECLEEINDIIYNSISFWVYGTIERHRIEAILDQIEKWGDL